MFTKTSKPCLIVSHFLFSTAILRFSRFPRRLHLLLVIVFDETLTPFSGHPRHWSRFWENNYEIPKIDERVVPSSEEGRKCFRRLDIGDARLAH